MTTTTHAAYCTGCDCRYAAVPSATGMASAYEYEPDGFTVSAIRHICWPRGERVGRLIEARRARGYAAKFRAETMAAEPAVFLEPTDENLAAIVSRPSIVRPARPDEYPAIRAALASWQD